MKFQLLRNIVDVRARRVGVVRLALLALPFFVLLGMVAAGTARFQFMNRDAALKEARKNMICELPLPPVRGDIRDRNGVLLATDNSDYRIVRLKQNCFWDEVPLPADLTRKAMTNDEFAALSEAQREDMEKQRFIQVSQFMAGEGNSPELFVQAVPRRVYPGGKHISHIIGYLGEINPSEIRLYRHRGYHQGDRVGKSGVERSHETTLNGAPGRRVIKINAPGQYLADQETIYATRGKDLRLTIDERLQKAAYHALKDHDKIGGVVFMKPDGQILALATNPSFSSEPGRDGLTPLRWGTLAMAPDHPLVNRAISSHLPLGSVFKLVVATAALETGVATPKTVFHCPGYYVIPGRQSYPPKCYAAHGAIDFINGIALSCDVVFYTLGQKLGVTNIASYAKMMGLGRRTGIDLPGESVGLVPDADWKLNFGDGREWNAGDTINLSIGQGDVQITPIQVARMVNVIASGGKLVTPHVAFEGDWPVKELPIQKSTLDAVRLGMRGAVTHGTCARMSDFDYPVAAKTGTAETGVRGRRKKSHAWFAGFAPYDYPVVTFAVYVEHGGYGAVGALPVAREVLEKAKELGYFKDYPALDVQAAALRER